MSARLAPYVPRLVLSWAKETPQDRYRRIDGTMVFCDVSGFTALSERLARRGKVGAEELTEILDAVFSSLLEQAARFGGSMLKYGGDAVLVFFWGEGHARRGVAAAAAMRAALRSSGRSGPQRRAALGMSVGVHSGGFDFFLVGDSHRELVVAGPAATLTCAMEADAATGQILLSPDCAASLNRSELGGRRGGGVLLARAPKVRDVELASIAVPLDIDAAPFTPVALRQHLEDGGGEPEHRLVTIAFLGFSGVDAGLERDGGAQMADRIERLMTVVQSRCDEHGVTFLGSDIYRDGGKVIAVAGAPKSWENNDERLVRAMRSVVDDYTELPLHVGISRGFVFTGEVGPVFRRTYTALGDAVNTAARIMASCSDSQIRALPEVLQRSITLFEAVEQPPFVAKGKKEPVCTVAVGPIVGRRLAADDVPLVGRREEMAELLADVELVAGGAGRVHEIVADAGMGKTRLLGSLVAAAPQLKWHTTTCEAYESDTAYCTLRSLLRLIPALAADDLDQATLASVVGDLAPEQLPWLPLLGIVTGVVVPSTPEVDRLEPQFAPARLVRVVDALFAAVPARRPRAWIVDDAHFIDAATAQLLVDLVRRLTLRGWLVIVARRPDLGPLGSTPLGPVLTLGPLSAGDGLALARAHAPSALPHLLAIVAERAGGHPLFTLQLADRVGDSTDVEHLPDTVEAAITARIDELAPDTRQLLRTAAVLGTSFDRGTLRELEPAADLTAIDAFVTVEGDTVRFRQTLFQQVAYEGLPFRRRRVLHSAAARLLRADGDGDDERHVERLSRHYHEAQDYPHSWEFSTRAAKLVEARFAPLDATAFYRRALAAATHLRTVDRAEIRNAWERVGTLTLRCGELQAARDAFARARKLTAGDPASLAGISAREGAVALEGGRWTEALRRYRKGLRVLGDDRSTPDAIEARTRLLVGVATLRIRRGDYAAALVDGALALESAKELNNPIELANVHLLIGGAELMLGAPGAEASCRAALDLFEQEQFRWGEGSALNNLGMLAYYAGRWDEAVDLYERARQAHEAAGNFSEAAGAAMNGGEVLLDQGRLAEARRVLEDALATFEAAGHWYALYARRYLAVLDARRGQTDAARAALDDIAQRFAAMGSDAEVADTTVRAAMVDVLAHRPDDALARLRALESDQFPHLAGALQRARAAALAATGAADAAMQAAHVSLTIERANGDALGEALTQALLAALTSDPESSERHDAAAARFAALGVIEPLRLVAPARAAEAS